MSSKQFIYGVVSPALEVENSLPRSYLVGIYTQELPWRHVPPRGEAQATVKLHFRSEGGQRALNTLPWEGGGKHMFLGDLGGETRSNLKRSVTFSLGRVAMGWRIWVWSRCCDPCRAWVHRNHPCAREAWHKGRTR